MPKDPQMDVRIARRLLLRRLMLSQSLSKAPSLLKQ